MDVSLLTGEYRSGKVLCDLLESNKYCNFQFAVAYARRSGVRLLKPAMQKFINHNGNDSMLGIVGVNQGNTSYQGVRLLSDIINGGLYLRFSQNYQSTFHPKMYIFKKHHEGNVKISIAVIGSSNMTVGGLKTNEECDVLLEDIQNNRNFTNSIESFLEDLRVTRNGFNTIRATPDIIQKFQDCGALVNEDEKRKMGSSNRASKDVEQSISEIIKNNNKPKHRCFAMTLSNFDVSARSQDPVILVPLTARNIDERFWLWPGSFVQEREFADLYLDSSVNIDGKVISERIRIYDYPNKSEFRLKSEIVKRRGNVGDILLVERDDDNFLLSVIRKSDEDRYRSYESRLTTMVSSQKSFGYFN